MFKVKQQKKGLIKIISVFVVLLVIVGLCWGFAGVRDYFIARSLAGEGEKLMDEKKYSEAVDSYQKSLARWDSDSVEKSLEEVKKLSSSESNYQNGLKAYKKKHWSDAKRYFSKVEKIHYGYSDSQKKIKTCDKKIQEEKKRKEEEMNQRVKGAKDEGYQSGTSAGYSSGYSVGEEEGAWGGAMVGYDVGYDDGYNNGYADGYMDGMLEF